MSPHLERIRAKAEALTCDFSAEDWRRARPGGWSALGIFEHLTLTFIGTTKGTLEILQAPEPFCREIRLRDRVAQFYVVGLGIFPKGRKAPANTIPCGDLGDDSLRKFKDALVAMDATLNDAERRFGKKTRMMEHPVLGPLTVEQWRRFHRVHGLHHLARIGALRQAARARNAHV